MTEPLTSAQLVVVGSSAGGIEALSVLVASLPKDFPAPIILAQHLDPRRVSHLREILERRSTLPVRTVEDQDRLEPGVVFVVPANRDVEVTDHTIAVREQDGTHGPRPSIDRLFSSAAQVFGEGLIAVVLTGTGSDGAAGARDVKSTGGTVVVQNPETASYPGLPLSLAPTTVDIVANLEAIGPLLYDLLTGAYTPWESGDGTEIRSFLDQLRERSGIDFTSYKMPTIMRRLQRRMVATGHDNLGAYIRYLQQTPDEYQPLVNSFLIKVTEFFRDAELFKHLREQILPELIAEARNRNDELRIWSAGCATGEEAYSLAILVCDILGDELEQFTVRIFATDLDATAVSFARRGVYPESVLTKVPPELVERYFTSLDDTYEVKKAVRNLLVFGQHDLGQRAPFPRVDLALCRNVLIYFTTELQKRALQLFAFSLRDGGYLALGKAETTSPLPEFFALEQPRLKIYRRVGERALIPPARIKAATPTLPLRLVSAGRSPTGLEPALSRVQREQRSRTASERLDSLPRRLPIGVVLVDHRYDIQAINGAARRLLGIHAPAVGDDFVHLVQDLPSTALRATIDAAFRHEPATGVYEVPTADATADPRHVEVSCYPETIDGRDGPPDSVVILVTDVTAAARERRDLQQAYELQQSETQHLATRMARVAETNRHLVDVNQELTDINADLRSSNEELLVSNEEVQAATEEVETLNEELQATNEEMETLNEELQATVEELNTTNDDLQERSIELQDSAALLEEQRGHSENERARLEAILTHMADAVLVVDREGRPVLTNAAYNEKFGEQSGSPRLDDRHGQPLSADATPRARAARGGPFSMDFTTTAGDGTRCWFEANGQSIRRDDEELGVVVIRDITDRSLRRLHDEFLATASHELRTPLTALGGYLQMVKRQMAASEPNEERLRGFVDQSLTQARRLGALINDLVDVTRMQNSRIPLRLEPIDLTVVIARAAEAAEGLTQGQHLDLELASGPMLVNADSGRLEQVLLNLVSNAVTHARDSERIVIRSRRVDREAEIQVQDFGPGISVAHLPNLFSRFYQVTGSGGSSRQGLGLGLHISRELVVAHGGTIDVDSQEGEGATFTIRLPLADGPLSPR